MIDSTKITAIFDLTDAPHGLYDVKVINPNGSEAIVPYRYLVERTIEPDVNLGLGGSRVLAPGETGTYGIAIKSLTNIDTPYVHFQFGIPELGDNQFLFSKFDEAIKQAVGISKLPYVQLTSNLRGQPPQGAIDLPWASLISDLNTDGEILAPGYIFDLPTAEAVGRTFNVLTYPQLQELLKLQPDALNDLLPGEESKIAFRFHIQASATVLTRDEFIAQQRTEALRLRSAILKDRTASLALTVLAANENTWVTAYLAALEEAGLLRPENEAPSIRQDPLVVSLIATLASGVLVGPVGEQILTNGNLVNFFTQLRRWYGHNWDLIGQAEVPDATQYDLQQSKPTHYTAFNIYIPFGKARVDLPGGATVPPPNFTNFFSREGTVGELASLLGPVGALSEGYIPPGQPLPYTIQFENASTAASAVGEVRIVTQLDGDLDPRSFRLGDLRLGDLQINIPDGRSFFQGDFDFRTSKGFILRVSAGLDPLSNTATWLLSALDPLTGEVIQDPIIGLLPPNDVTGIGRGFVTYTVQIKPGVPTGTEITSTARILYNTSAPIDTATLTNLVDAVAPTTSIKVTPLGEGRSDYLVQWAATDDEMGSGVKHVTVYVSENGGNFTIWKRQTTDTEGVFLGKSGSTYEFLALATDAAGNTEKPNGITVPDDGSSPDLGSLPTLEQTSEPPIQLASPPNPNAVPNHLFIIASQHIPNTLSPIQPSEFEQVLRPFTAQAFATGIPTSHAQIGPMAIVILEDGSVVTSGGHNRGSLFSIPQTGGTATLLAEIAHPVFDLALAPNGQLWAVTGGGSLLQLDRTTGAIVKQYGDGITQALAINAQTGQIYVSSGNGIEIFDPETETFSHFSDRRVGNLAFAPDGTLWGVRWPERGEIVRFDETGKAQLMLDFDLPVDSLAFGQQNTRLAGLLFVSSNNGELLMVDLATRQFVTIASGGSRGDIVKTTADGRILLSQSQQIDVLNPLSAPQVTSTNPAPDALVALPNSTIAVTFNSDMLVGSGTEAFSVLNKANFVLDGENQEPLTPQTVRYDATTRTAYLSFAALEADHYELQVSSQLRSNAGMAMEQAYQVDFTAVSDFTPFVDLQLINTRSERATQTISFDVSLTNKTAYDLQLPLTLLLDPTPTTTGLPQGATQTENGYYLIDLSQELPDGRLRPGQSISDYTVIIYNPDALRLDFEPAILTLPYANAAPIFTSTPITAAVIGQPYTAQVSALDPDGSLLGYLLHTAPQGMNLDPVTGVISWNPTANSPGLAEVVLQAYDTRGGRSTQSFTIHVAGGNQKPVFAPLPDLIRGFEGQPLVININAADPESSSLLYWADRLPSGAWFDPIQRTFNWTPDFASSGTYENVTFIVSDGLEQITQKTTFLIAPSNQKPTLLPPIERTIIEGDAIRLQLQGSDPDGQKLSYFGNLLPSGSQLDPDTGIFTWTPTYFQAGVHEISFSVSDGEQIATQTTQIPVLNANVAPIFDSLENWQVAEGQTIRFRAFAFDPDNPGFVPPERMANGQLTLLEGSEPSVTYTVSNLPSGASFDPDTAIFSWTPDFASAGTYHVTFSATDNGNGLAPKTSTITVPLIVRDLNRAPEIAAISNQTLQRGDVLDLILTASDPDGHPITLTATGVGGFGLPEFTTLIQLGDGKAKLHLAPGMGDRGDYPISLKATDSLNETDEFTFVVSVQSPNEAPQMGYIGNQVALVDTPLALTINVSDLDGEALTFSTDGLPEGATLTPTNVYGQAVLRWTPSATALGTHPITIRVTDQGNGKSEQISTEQTFNLVVRQTNHAPVWSTLPQLTVAEAEMLSLTLSATAPDGDQLTYTATNLPQGAVLNPQTGLLTWQPSFWAAGTYNNIQLTASDGNLSSTQNLTVQVTNRNRSPVLAPLPLQSGRENTLIQFFLAAGDLDRDSITYSTLSALPAGATLNAQTGEFSWKPNYNQAGNYRLKFAATDSLGARNVQEVVVNINNVNRVPSLIVSPQIVALGETLSFSLIGQDPDGDPLTYSAANLPFGATLNPQTGAIDFRPVPGLEGEYLVSYRVSDGLETIEKNSLLKVETTPTRPSVTVALTPSFPALPGQPVVMRVLADSFTDITHLGVAVNGQSLELDALGRATFVSSVTGRFEVSATATDAAGRIGQTREIFRVADPNDSAAPIVSFTPGLERAKITTPTALVATISDHNLEEWVLSISNFGEDNFRTLAQGYASATEQILAQLDPGQFSNGFYQLQLQARDLKGRISFAQIVVEVNSLIKTSQYSQSQTDLSFNLGGTTLNLVRRYDSSELEGGSFGKGWQLANLETDLQTNVPSTRQEYLGIFAPFELGTRLYLTLPDSRRVGFTFAPVERAITGLTYYTPAWVADAGVDYTLGSTLSS